jgi:hypothetical protein
MIEHMFEEAQALDPQVRGRVSAGFATEDRIAVLHDDPSWDDDLPGIDLEAAYAAHSAASEEDRLPMGVDEWEPGPVLAVLLSTVDIAKLPDSDQVTALRAHQRMASHHQARMYEAMIALSESLAEELGDIGVGDEAAVAEIRAALRLTRRAAQHQMGMAYSIRSRLPDAWLALERGRIDRSRAYELVRGTSHLAPDVARQVVERVLGDAHRLTTGQLAERIRRECIDIDPEDASARHTASVEERRVVTDPSPHGTVDLLALDLPPTRTAEAMDRINRIARQLHTAAETRSMDQLRADVMLDLLCGTGEHPVAGSVRVNVDLTTLAELDDHPGDLAGYGPVIADIARQAARGLTNATWEFAVVDPGTGRPVFHGTTRRRPTAHQRRAVRAADRVCVFPGCRVPAVASDLDHTIPWADGGPTTEDNLAPLCRADHCLRHQAGWTYVRTPDGDHRWTSRLGHTYTTSGRDP